MSNPILTKKQVLLDRKPTGPNAWSWGDDREVFTSEGDDRLVPQVSLLLDPDEWEALGSPDHLTVTIDPGDLLNPGVRVDHLPRHIKGNLVPAGSKGNFA